MAQNDDGRDEIDEVYEPLSLDEMIKEAEESGGFEEFLNRTTNRGGKWTSTSNGRTQSQGADAAAQSSGSSSGARDATASSEPKSVQSAIDPKTAAAEEAARQEALRQKLGEIDTRNGIGKSHQDAHAEGEVPEPAIKEIPEPPKVTTEEAPITTTDVTVHQHPIVGFYSSSNTHRIEEDDEMRAMHLNARNKGVTEMTWQEVQDVIKRMERQAVLHNRAHQGFREALEIHLMKMNLSDRASALERDRAIRARVKAKPTGESKPKKASTGKVVGVASNDRKAADTLHKLGFDKDECIERLKKDGKEITQDFLAFIEKLYSGV